MCDSALSSESYCFSHKPHMYTTSCTKGPWYTLTLWPNNGLASLQVCWCRLSEFEVVYIFPHWQAYFFSPVWRIMWAFNLSGYLKALVQKLHFTGWLGSWWASCLFKALLWANSALQNEHLWGFCPVWVFICSFHPVRLWNCLVHKLHLYGSSLSVTGLWVSIWLLSLLCSKNLNPQTLQWNFFSWVCLFLCCCT